MVVEEVELWQRRFPPVGRLSQETWADRCEQRFEIQITHQSNHAKKEGINSG
jgi:hypothetical protein